MKERAEDTSRQRASTSRPLQQCAPEHMQPAMPVHIFINILHFLCIFVLKYLGNSQIPYLESTSHDICRGGYVESALTCEFSAEFSNYSEPYMCVSSL